MESIEDRCLVEKLADKTRLRRSSKDGNSNGHFRRLLLQNLKLYCRYCRRLPINAIPYNYNRCRDIALMLLQHWQCHGNIAQHLCNHCGCTGMRATLCPVPTLAGHDCRQSKYEKKRLKLIFKAEDARTNLQKKKKISVEVIVAS